MKNPFSWLVHARDKPKPKDSVSSAPSFYFGSSNAGKSVTVNSAMQLSTVYACVRVIAETIASLPLNVFESTDSGNKKATNHPLQHVLHDEPNSEMTSFVWREVMLSHLLLWGNSYSQIIRTGRNKIAQLYPLLPDHMAVDRDSSGALTYTYTTSTGATVVLRPEDVLHIPGLGFDGVMGYSPIALERNAIGLGIAAEEYGSKFFSNGARPSGVLTHPNTVKDPQRLRDSWNAAYGGSSNSGRVAVIEEGMRFEPIAIPNNEAQFLETRRFQVEEICRIYRVPPHMIGDLERATFSNIESQNISFAVHTIRPWLTRIEQVINRTLFSENEKGRFFVQFNLDGLMRGDYKSRMEGYSIARQNGWMSANDIRELENMNPIPEEEGGNVYMVNGNMVPITYTMLSQDNLLMDLNMRMVQYNMMLVNYDDMLIQHDMLLIEYEKALLELALEYAMIEAMSENPPEEDTNNDQPEEDTNNDQPEESDTPSEEDTATSDNESSQDEGGTSEEEENGK